jgi:beta-N-acetylhexosaminidase
MMNGATLSAGSLSRAAKQAFLAGNDIIMLSKTPNLSDPVWTSLVLAMREEGGFRERVRDAARRVLITKLKYLRGEKAVPYVPDLRRLDTELPTPESSAFFLSLAARSVTVVRGAIPLSPKKAGKVLLAGQFEDFFSAGKKAYPGAAQYYYSPARGSWELNYYAREADTVIFCISDAAGLSLLRSLQNLGKPVYVLSVLSPAYIEDVTWAEGVIAVYSYAPESFTAGFSALLGRIPAPGKLPLPPGNSPSSRGAQ